MLHHQSGMVCLEGGIEITLPKLQEIYLDWINNFLTVERFAEYYALTVEEANVIIQAGHKIQGLYAQMLKDLQSLVLN
ncbi:hypothetical protein ErPhphiEa104_gp027 [Erwinia phage phiEa104]|uniref:Uncharacterized protein n=7 Tax=Caudoviricetes TaxID=2731619 RepID=A0A346FHR8_9CAUD|nr:hypothetical protein Ea21-4_gp26 [Erwinia phage phiEa21-4]YP_004327002.1 hypothetical protein ErPhphiEa104_gp027 [Erwinia phage phiEa104]AXN57348.1 hypothetical protein SUNLIREN_26 [Erwinia phage SunLIRen]AYD79613.1 hypothetical protein LINGLNFE_00131 [Enterobacter phage phi63_307]QEG07680.1 hypothetical protein [Salmonella phage SE5]QGF21877.1 hypothetical protein [Salmonella phage ST-3]UXD79828.1 hypothetical protein 4Roscha1_00138 [Erwinia phage Roscha1]WJN64422.1 hypothetical protein 